MNETNQYDYVTRVDGGIEEEVCAAIALALECYNKTEHDSESFTLTIRHGGGNTAWNSHAATLRRLPLKK